MEFKIKTFFFGLLLLMLQGFSGGFLHFLIPNAQDFPIEVYCPPKHDLRVNELKEFTCYSSVAKKCPEGLKLGKGGRCEDINHCSNTDACPPEKACLNEYGGTGPRCIPKDCPTGYKTKDTKPFTYQCVRSSPCEDMQCLKNTTQKISYYYKTLESNCSASEEKPKKIFSITVQSDIKLDEQTDFIGVKKLESSVVNATVHNFYVKKVASSKLILYLTKNIQGPQEILIRFTVKEYDADTNDFLRSNVIYIMILVSKHNHLTSS